jgi:hypothetical protein
MERIEINGVWHVREDSQSPKTLTIGENDVTHFRGIVHESDNYCFEASKLYKDFTSGQDHDDIAIEVTFKEKGVPQKEWRTEYWDSVSFFLNLAGIPPSSKRMENRILGFCKFLPGYIEKPPRVYQYLAR